MAHVDEDDRLSLAAVGLWHKLHHLHGSKFDALDVLTVHPDPNAWGPFDEVHDLEMPLDELRALGYAEDVGTSIHLYPEVEV